MTAQWAPDGAARAEVTGDANAGITAILTGMGSLSYGELAGERMRLGLMLNDPEEEHDCFADNTYNSHYYDQIGVRNVYLGQYVDVDGRLVEGPSVSDLIAAADADVDGELQAALNTTVARLGELKLVAEGGMAYDQMLAADNAAGGAVIQRAVDALVAQTKAIERGVSALEIESDRLRRVRQPRQSGRGFPIGEPRVAPGLPDGGRLAGGGYRGGRRFAATRRSAPGGGAPRRRRDRAHRQGAGAAGGFQQGAAVRRHAGGCRHVQGTRQPPGVLASVGQYGLGPAGGFFHRQRVFREAVGHGAILDARLRRVGAAL